MERNRLTLGYALLVGAPLLVLLTASELGKGLTAPPAVSGEWTVRWEAATWASSGCVDGASTVTITQSGEDVVVTWNDPGKTQWQGTLENGRLSAQGACGATRTARLEAEVTGEKTQRVLRGRLRVDGCERCEAVGFTAVRSMPQGERSR